MDGNVTKKDMENHCLSQNFTFVSFEFLVILRFGEVPKFHDWDLTIQPFIICLSTSLYDFYFQM
jgi:hypothetical protein